MAIKGKDKMLAKSAKNPIPVIDVGRPGMIDPAKPVKPTSLEFMVKAEKKKMDGKDEIHFSCRSRDYTGPDKPENSFTSIESLVEHLSKELHGAVGTLGGKSEKKEIKKEPDGENAK